MTRPCLKFAGWSFLLSLLAGCTSAAPQRIGRTWFAAEPPPAPTTAATPAIVVSGAEHREYLPIHPLRPLGAPIYPAEALKGRSDDYSVHVLLTVDESGRVTDVAPSWRHVRLAHPYDAAFLEAIRAAVRQWELSPARWITSRRTAAGEDVYLRSEAVAETFEMRFDFASTPASP
jgi:hypothetical protein